MSELQPGTMAILIGALQCPANIGKCVTVCERGPDHLAEKYGDCYFVEGVEPYLMALAKHLMPIKPEADPLDVTHKEELHA